MSLCSVQFLFLIFSGISSATNKAKRRAKRNNECERRECNHAAIRIWLWAKYARVVTADADIVRRPNYFIDFFFFFFIALSTICVSPKCRQEGPQSPLLVFKLITQHFSRLFIKLSHSIKAYMLCRIICCF